MESTVRGFGKLHAWLHWEAHQGKKSRSLSLRFFSQILSFPLETNFEHCIRGLVQIAKGVSTPPSQVMIMLDLSKLKEDSSSN